VEPTAVLTVAAAKGLGEAAETAACIRAIVLGVEEEEKVTSQVRLVRRRHHGTLL